MASQRDKLYRDLHEAILNRRVFRWRDLYQWLDLLRDPADQQDDAVLLIHTALFNKYYSDSNVVKDVIGQYLATHMRGTPPGVAALARAAMYELADLNYGVFERHVTFGEVIEAFRDEPQPTHRIRMISIVERMAQSSGNQGEGVMALLESITQETNKQDVFRTLKAVRELMKPVAPKTSRYPARIIEGIPPLFARRVFFRVKEEAVWLLEWLLEDSHNNHHPILEGIGLAGFRALLGRQPPFCIRVTHQRKILEILQLGLPGDVKHSTFFHEGGTFNIGHLRLIVTQLFERYPLDLDSLLSMYYRIMQTGASRDGKGDESDAFIYRLVGLAQDVVAGILVLAILRCWATYHVQCIRNIIRINATGIFDLVTSPDSGHSGTLKEAFASLQNDYRGAQQHDNPRNYVAPPGFHLIKTGVFEGKCLPGDAWSAITIRVPAWGTGSFNEQRHREDHRFKIVFPSELLPRCKNRLGISAGHPLLKITNHINLRRHQESRKPHCSWFNYHDPGLPDIVAPSRPLDVVMIGAFPDIYPPSLRLTFHTINSRGDRKPIPSWFTLAQVCAPALLIEREVTWLEPTFVRSEADGAESYDVYIPTGAGPLSSTRGFINELQERIADHIDGPPPRQYLSVCFRELYAGWGLKWDVEPGLVRFVGAHPSWFDMGVRLITFAIQVCPPWAIGRIYRRILRNKDGDWSVAASDAALRVQCDPSRVYGVGREILLRCGSGLYELDVTFGTGNVLHFGGVRFFPKFAQVVAANLLIQSYYDGLIPSELCEPADFWIMGNLLGRAICQLEPLGIDIRQGYFDHLDNLGEDHLNYKAFTCGFGQVFPGFDDHDSAYKTIRTFFRPAELALLVTLEGCPWIDDADVLS
jgi:hypothetical protein